MEYQEKFKKHVKARLAFIQNGNYQDLFGLPSVTIAYATTGSRERAQHMVAWTEEVLETANLRKWATIFRFLSLGESLPDPKLLFEEPSWFQPFAEHTLPLFSI